MSLVTSASVVVLGMLSERILAVLYALNQATSEFLGGVDRAASTAGITTAVPPAALVGNFINAILGVVGIVFVIVLIYAGILYMTAEGAEEKVVQAKRMISAALIGIVIIVAAYAISIFVITQLTKVVGFITTAYAAGASETLEGLGKAGGAAGFGATPQTSAELIANVISAILALTGIVFVIILVYGGILYLTAQGEEERVTKAKQMMANAVIGIIIIVAASLVAHDGIPVFAIKGTVLR